MWMCLCGPTSAQLNRVYEKTCLLPIWAPQLGAYLLRCKEPGRSLAGHPPQVRPRKLTDWDATKALENQPLLVKILGNLKERRYV